MTEGTTDTASRLVHGEVTQDIIGCFYGVYNILGFGYLENVHLAALSRDLTRGGHVVRREVPTPVRYKDEIIANYRVDLVVDGKVIVEVKSSRLPPLEAERQVYSYLRATNFEVGLLLHFGPKPKFSRLLLTADHKPIDPETPEATQSNE
jgi:GxxExxY protein